MAASLLLTPDEILQGLNARQQEAVRYCDGPLLVLAGPGTGKTRVITEKVLYLVAQHKFDPQSILALTFTKKATEEMAERIRTRLASAGIHEQPYIGTFHSFCFDLIREYGEALGYHRDLRLLNGAFYVHFVLQYLDDLEFQYTDLAEPHEALRWAGAFAHFLSRCHDEALLDHDLERRFEDWLKSPDFDGDRDAALAVLDLIKAIPIIRDKQKQFNVVTFGDLLTGAVTLLRTNRQVLQELQDRYQYILVDEFQDNNTAQFELVNLLAAEHRRVLVVGDEDQCIYRFRGAGLDLVKRFQEHWGTSKVVRLGSQPRKAERIAAKPAGSLHTVTLEENYRSTDAIIEVFTALIECNQNRLGQKLLRRASSSSAQGPDHVRLMHFPTDADECRWIVEQIRTLVEPQGQGGEQRPARKPGDIAVLCRSLNHVANLIGELRANGLAVEVVGEAGLFGDSVVRETLAWLFTLDNPNEEEVALHRVLRFHGFGLSYADQYAIGQYARSSRKPLMAVIEELARKPRTSIQGLSQRGRKQLTAFARLHERFRIETQAQSSPDLVEVVHRVARCAGLHAYLKPDTPEGRRHLSAFGGLLHLAEQYRDQYPNPNLHGFVKFLKLLESLGHDETVGEPSEDPDSVKVMTVHQAKGREFPVVFVGGLTDRFPSAFQRDRYVKFLDFLTLNGQDPKQLHREEERRVLYVALSRAKEELILSCYDQRSDGTRNRNKAPFLSEIEQASSVRKNEHPGYAAASAASPPVAGAQRKTVEDALFHHVSWVGRHLGQDDLEQYFRELLSLLSGLLADTVGKEKVRQALSALGLPHEFPIHLPQADQPVAPQGTLKLMPTSLEVYARCPRQFYYKFVVQIPEPERRAAQLGNAVHKALELLHQKHAKLSRHLLPELLQYFEQEFAKVHFPSKTQQQDALERGKQVLQRFLEEEADRAEEIQHTEVEKELQLPLDNDIWLSMRIDRLDTLQDGSIRVLDYKTGRLKSGPEYIRQFQMPCYALAVQKCLEGPLVWVEVVGLHKLNDNGRTHRKILEWEEQGNEEKLSPARLAQLAMQIQDTAANIRAGKFEPKPEAETCRFCAYRMLCDKAFGTLE